MKIKLQDGQQIDVWAANTLMTEIKHYPYYFMHPEFGVLRNLDGKFVDKSPLCRVLDETIEILLNWR